MKCRMIHRIQQFPANQISKSSQMHTLNQINFSDKKVNGLLVATGVNFAVKGKSYVVSAKPEVYSVRRHHTVFSDSGIVRHWCYISARMA
jgi:hypothetical protein